MKPSEEIFHQKTDYKKIVIKFLRYKYYFILAVIFSISVAFVLNKVASRKFSNFTTILINDESSNSFLTGEDILQSGLFSGIENVEDEIEILSSFSMVNRAVNEMNLEVSYFFSENFFPFDLFTFEKEVELYTDTPISVIFDQTHIQPVSFGFYVDPLNDSVFKLSGYDTDVSCYDYIANKEVVVLDSLNVNGIYKFGEKIVHSNYSFTVYLKDVNSSFIREKRKLVFKFNNLIHLALSYLQNLAVFSNSPTSSVVKIALYGSHPIKITDFLNILTKVYLDENLEKKNKKAFNTIQFIDARISDISDSLSFAENKLQSFRSRNQVMNLSFQGQKLYEKMNEYETQRAELTMMQSYFKYIEEYINSNDDVTDLMAPSSMEVNDPTLSLLISELIELNSQRMNYIENNPKNLFVKDLDIQIDNIKKTILENIDYKYKRSEISLQEIDSRVAKLNSQITYLPKTERELIGMERQFKLNDAIYTFLLQKRAEAQIARASNYSDYEIVNKSQYFNAIVTSPKTKMSYIIAIFIGLFVPFSIILIRDFFNSRISDLGEIEEISSLPIIGQIWHNTTKSKAIIRDYPKSPLADSFRSIRTNLQFFSKGVDKMVLLITSSSSGEGKSFCSMNLASVYALLGKKTLLLGFDLRRPALFDDLNLKNDKGITSYLINNNKVNEIIQHTEIDNLDFIAAGPIPPNPVELIASDKTKFLIDELKNKYDYIIIDSAPIGAVTDSFLLFKYADLNVFTIRHNYTIKEALEFNLNNIDKKKISNVSLLINDIKIRKNDYGYTFQSKYYLNPTKRSFGHRFKVFFKGK